MFPSLPSSIDYCLIASIESGGDISQRARVSRRNIGWLHISFGGSLDNPAQDQQTSLHDKAWTWCLLYIALPGALMKGRLARYCFVPCHASQLHKWFILSTEVFKTIITCDSDTCLCLILPDSFSTNDKVAHTPFQMFVFLPLLSICNPEVKNILVFNDLYNILGRV